MKRCDRLIVSFIDSITRSSVLFICSQFQSLVVALFTHLCFFPRTNEKTNIIVSDAIAFWNGLPCVADSLTSMYNLVECTLCDLMGEVGVILYGIFVR